jgi:hypothetical protein
MTATAEKTTPISNQVSADILPEDNDNKQRVRDLQKIITSSNSRSQIAGAINDLSQVFLDQGEIALKAAQRSRDPELLNLAKKCTNVSQNLIIMSAQYNNGGRRPSLDDIQKQRTYLNELIQVNQPNGQTEINGENGKLEAMNTQEDQQRQQ